MRKWLWSQCQGEQQGGALIQLRAFDPKPVADGLDHRSGCGEPDAPATALLGANLALRGKPGPLLWTGERELPQVVNDYLWSQRAAFWVTPAEGPFHHFWILGDTTRISFPAQGQADYAVEIGPYRMKGPGMAGMDMLAASWIALGLASAAC